jgi:integrase
MKNLFKRKKNYYYRIVVPIEFKRYFNNLNLYIRSLKTNNKNEAILLTKFLTSKLNFIKSQKMLLTKEQLNSIIEDFKLTNLDSIKNRHKTISIDNIDTLIKYYDNKKINLHDRTLKREIEALSKIFVKNNIDTIFDTDTTDIDFLVDEIVRIKLNVLHNLRDDINKTISIDINEMKNLQQNNGNSSNIKDFTIEECKIHFLEIHEKKLRYEENIDLLIEYCKSINITKINDISRSTIIKFRNHQKNTTKLSKTTINNGLTHLSTFFKTIIADRLYSYQNPTFEAFFKLSTKEKSEIERDAFEDKEIKILFDNLDILRLNSKNKKLKKYGNEYEIIFKIAMYSGARESEILGLTKDDILLEEESKIKYFRFIVDNEDKSIKNDNSWRFVPIHPHLEDDLYTYINSISNNKLFQINLSYLSKNFSLFKTEIGFSHKLAFHSFRHSVANKLKNKGKDTEVGEEITGHAKKTSFNRYAKSYDLINKKEVLDKIFYKLD